MMPEEKFGNCLLGRTGDFEDIIDDAIYEFTDEAHKDGSRKPSCNAEVFIGCEREVILSLAGTDDEGDNIENTITFESYGNFIKVTYDGHHGHAGMSTYLLLTPKKMMQYLNGYTMYDLYKLFNPQEVNHIKANITVMCEKIQYPEEKRRRKRRVVKYNSQL